MAPRNALYLATRHCGYKKIRGGHQTVRYSELLNTNDWGDYCIQVNATDFAATSPQNISVLFTQHTHTAHTLEHQFHPTIRNITISKLINHTVNRKSKEYGIVKVSSWFQLHFNSSHKHKHKIHH